MDIDFLDYFKRAKTSVLQPKNPRDSVWKMPKVWIRWGFEDMGQGLGAGGIYSRGSCKNVRKAMLISGWWYRQQGKGTSKNEIKMAVGLSDRQIHGCPFEIY